MNSTGSGRPERLASGVITTEAAAAIPDGVLAVEMAADQDPQPGARAAARLFGELQRSAVTTLSRPTVRSSSTQRIWSRSTRPTGTKAEAGSAGGRPNSALKAGRKRSRT